MSLVVEVTNKRDQQKPKQQTSQISSHQNFQVKLKIELQSIIQHSNRKLNFKNKNI